MKKVACLLLIFLVFSFPVTVFGEEIKDDFPLEYYKGQKFSAPVNSGIIKDDNLQLITLKAKAARLYEDDYEDEFVKEHFKGKKFKKRKIKDYDFEHHRSRMLKIRSVRNVSTKYDLNEGDYIDFQSVYAFKANGKFYPEGTKMRGKIETLSKQGLRGVPSDLIIGNFEIEGLNEPVDYEIAIRGANRSIWIYPVMMTAGLIIPGSGVLLNFIEGGHAKIKKGETFEIDLD